MNTLQNSRKEVLIAELLGEMDALLTRVATVAPVLDAASVRLAQSAQGLATSADRYRQTTQAIVDHSQKSAVMHIVRRTNEVAQVSLDEQTTAMKTAARTVFDNEATSQLRNTTTQLRDLSATLANTLNRASAPKWHDWLTHMTTALVSAGATAALLLHLLRP